MLYEIHMLKNYAPTNLNRDDTGAPKTCVYGGVTRGRISSQSLKRSWRQSSVFREAVGEENLGIRTRKLPELVADQLMKMGFDREMVEAVAPHISGFGNAEGKENSKDPTRTAQVVFYANEDVQAVVDIAAEALKECKNAKEAAKLKASELQKAVKNANLRPISVDIALFGRMVTSDAFADVEASMQVAHAISTHKVSLESDYFTAMDDLLKGEDLDSSGAAMIGDVDYNASCYYIYASVDSDALLKNLEKTPDARQLVETVIPAILRTMTFTNPTGKQNSFAGHTLPSAILVECKEKKIPTSMANAFVKPAKATEKEDLVEASIRKLADEATMISKNFGLDVTKRLWFCVDKYPVCPECDAVECDSFEKLVSEIRATLK